MEVTILEDVTQGFHRIIGVFSGTAEEVAQKLKDAKALTAEQEGENPDSYQWEEHWETVE